MNAAELNRISEGIIGAAIAVHRELGPGLLEAAYEACLLMELIERGFDVQRQLILPLEYRGQKVDAGFRLDILVNSAVILELKCVDRVHPVIEAQLQTYLKLTKLNLGLILNFNVVRLVDGIKRIVRDFPDE